MNKTAFLLAVFILLFCHSAQCAVVIGADSGKVADTISYSVPDFYYPAARVSRDTVFIFRCYDKRDSLMEFVDDYEQVRYYSEFKEYIDSFHTYKDTNGVKQFLPVSVIVRRYDRVARDRWMCISYPGNKYTELKADRSADAGATLVQIRRSNAIDLIKVFNYYKTTVVSH